MKTTLGRARKGRLAGRSGVQANLVRMSGKRRYKLNRELKDKTIAVLKRRQKTKEHAARHFDATPRLVKKIPNGD